MWSSAALLFRHLPALSCFVYHKMLWHPRGAKWQLIISKIVIEKPDLAYAKTLWWWERNDLSRIICTSKTLSNTIQLFELQFPSPAYLGSLKMHTERKVVFQAFFFSDACVSVPNLTQAVFLRNPDLPEWIITGFSWMKMYSMTCNKGTNHDLSNYMDVSKNRGTSKWMVYKGKPY